MKHQNPESAKKYRFNVIDLLVLLLLAAVVFVAVKKVGAVKAQANATVNSAADLNQISEAPEGFQPQLRFECVATGIEPELARRLQDNTVRRIYNSYRLLNAYVTDVVIEPEYIAVTDEGGELTSAVDPLHVSVRFTVEAMLNEKDENAFIAGNTNPQLGTQEIRVGKAYTLKTMAIELPVTIVDMEAVHD